MTTPHARPVSWESGPPSRTERFRQYHHGVGRGADAPSSNELWQVVPGYPKIGRRDCSVLISVLWKRDWTGGIAEDSRGIRHQWLQPIWHEHRYVGVLDLTPLYLR